MMLVDAYIGRGAPKLKRARGAAAEAPVATRGVRGTVSGEVTTVNVGGVGISLRAPGPIARLWQGLIEKQSPQVASPNQLLKFTKTMAEQLLTDAEFRAQNPGFGEWIKALLQGLPPTASQGIVIGGSKAGVVRIINNTVHNVMQGIHVGLSAGEGPGVQKLSAGRVLVAGNRVDVFLSSDATRGRHGIFAGNCDSLLVENNHLTLRHVRTNTLPTDGIRIWGILGRFMILRQNHVVSFDVGARVVPINAGSDNLWLVADNLLSGGLVAPRFVVSTAPAQGAQLNVY
jgi:hypothetical protein